MKRKVEKFQVGKTYRYPSKEAAVKDLTRIEKKQREAKENKRMATDESNKGRWWGREFCPHPGRPCIDGCYYCGREVKNESGDHDHTKVSKQGEPEEYSCVCETC